MSSADRQAGRSITILDTTYEAPVVRSDRLEELQADIERRRTSLTEETRQRRVFGLFPVPTQRRSPAERLQEMEALVAGYGELVHELGARIGDCRAFLGALSQGVRRFFGQKILQIRGMESERQAILARAAGVDAASRAAATRRLEAEGERIRGLARNLAAACLLMLKKIGLAWKALLALSGDEKLQREVLERLAGSVRLWGEVEALSRSVDALSDDIAKATRVAIEFDTLLEQGLGPFQALIEQTAEVDESVAETLAEIEQLNVQLERSDSAVAALEAQGGHDLLDLLTQARVKRDLVTEITDQLRNPDQEGEEFTLRLATEGAAPPAGGSPDLETTLANVEEILAVAAAGIFGPEQPGITPAQEAPARPATRKTAEPDRFGVLWERDLGQAIRAAPVALDGALVVCDDSGTVLRLDAGSGATFWKAAVGERVLAAAASTDRSVILLGTAGGTAVALDAASGEELWRHRAGARVEAEPAVAGDFAFVGAMDGTLSCLDARNGKLLWSSPAGTGVCGRVALLGDDMVMAAGTDAKVRGFDTKDGKELFCLSTSTRVTGGPAALGGVACMGSQDGVLILVGRRPDGGYAERWRRTIGSTNPCSPLFAAEGGVVLTGAANGLLYAFSVESGLPAGCWRLPGALVAVMSGPAESARQIAFAADKTGSVSALALADYGTAEAPSGPLCVHRASGRALVGVTVASDSGGAVVCTVSREGRVAGLRLSWKSQGV